MNTHTHSLERQQLRQSRSWVVKIGSALITEDGKGLAHSRIDNWVAQLAALRKAGVSIALVSSGAVAEGMARLGWRSRPSTQHELQAAAAVGQMGLIQAWESAFARHGLRTAQILLTHDDLANRRRYLNARSTLKTLLELGVIPIVNENDTVATDEIRFGDNDSLGAMVANLIEADILTLLTDQDGLFDADPRSNPEATLIADADADDEQLLQVAGSGGALGRGGMQTKVLAARKAARSGAHTLIARGDQTDILQRLFNGEPLGTLLVAASAPIAARKQWLASQLHAAGELHLDDGAAKALTQGDKSLLPIGVTAVEGNFQRGDLVRCLDAGGREIARGLCNYNTDDAKAIIGQASAQLAETLGYSGDPEMIHRDNLVTL
ncbi:glutamate 5-kinase [gamma proteobacterium HTCC5015]|nr:glutamate 5-kinase [gamma proteobacterium HTCC5015]